jgi:hypothetical protein
LRRLKKAVAWCYCQLSVSRHLATPSLAQRQFYLSAGSRERFGSVILRDNEIRTPQDNWLQIWAVPARAKVGIFALSGACHKLSPAF